MRLGMGSVGHGGRRRGQKNAIVSSAYERLLRLRLLLKIRVSVVRFRPWPPSSSRADSKMCRVGIGPHYGAITLVQIGEGVP